MFRVRHVAAGADPVAGAARLNGEHKAVRCNDACGGNTSDVTYRAARRFRSAVGYSMAPTPTAAVPLSGKNPCRPMMAEVNANEAPERDCVRCWTHRCVHPRLVATAPHDLKGGVNVGSDRAMAVAECLQFVKLMHICSKSENQDNKWATPRRSV